MQERDAAKTCIWTVLEGHDRVAADERLNPLLDRATGRALARAILAAELLELAHVHAPASVAEELLDHNAKAVAPLDRVVLGRGKRFEAFETARGASCGCVWEWDWVWVWVSV